jgi:hypothetical protein
VPVLIDMNNDMVDDFAFINFAGHPDMGMGEELGAFLGVGKLPQNAILGFGGSSFNKAVTFPKGSFQWGPSFLEKVSSSSFSMAQNSIIAKANSTKGGQFLPLASKGSLPLDGTYHLLLQFDIGGDLHFGYADLKTVWSAPYTLDASFSRLVYESEPDTDLHVDTIPEPGSLGMLALGAAGLFAMRRRLKKPE